MTYNMDFLIAGLVFLLLILVQFLGRDRVENTNSKIFQMFIMLGIGDITFDIISSVLIMEEKAEYAGILRVVLTLLYLMQVLVPYGLFSYTKSLCPTMMKMGKKLKVLDLPMVVMLGLVFYNIWSGIFFRVGEEGTYIKGSYYIGMYLYALLYVLIIMVGSITHYKTLGRRKLKVIWEFLLIMAGSVAVQAWNNELLMTGFGIGLGITVMYLTLNNPCEYIDTLTRAFNMQCFVDWMKEQFPKKGSVHLVIVDLVEIRKVNKIYGAKAGDALLSEIAERLRGIAASRYVFRIGGKRFAVVTYSLYEYEKVRKGVQKYFTEGIQRGGETVKLAAVVCGVTDAEQQKSNDNLLLYIDYLLSLAPESEEVIFLQGDEKTMQGFRYSQTVEQYLNTAIEEDLFEVYYQPVYSFRKGGYVTLEALSRLRHPALGPVSPEVFIDLAEKNGQIVDLSYLQFRRVCRFLKANPEMMEQIDNVKFNLSPMELLKAGYSRKLIETIREFDLPFSWFQFEITETVATEYSENLFRTVEDFTMCGIGLCLDDFGSGYANLDTVLKLPFSAIKLDKSLLNGIVEEPKNALFYKNIVAVLQNLGYRVIAEGVEYKEEELLLEQWGVDMIQGYYFAKPMPEAEIRRLVLHEE